MLGYVQEARAEQAVAALQRMAAATAGARRDGREERMQRPPRGLNDRIIDGAMWVGILWVGFVMAAVTLVALDLGLADHWLVCIGLASIVLWADEAKKLLERWLRR